MAGSKTNTFENAALLNVFNNDAIANIGDAAGLQPSAAAGSLFVALFTVAPGEAGGGTEAVYTGYARVAVARSSAGWTITDNVAANTAEITFGECTDGSETIIGAAIMTALTGGDMLYWNDDPNLAVSVGVIPSFAIGSLTITDG